MDWRERPIHALGERSCWFKALPFRIFGVFCGLNCRIQDKMSKVRRSSRTGAETVRAGVVLLIFLAAVSAVADTTITIGNGSGLSGTTVLVPVQFQTDANVVALQFEVRFDATRLSSGAATAGSALNGHLVNSAETTPGSHRVVIYSLANTRLTNGILVSIPFTIAPNATNGTATLSVTNVILADASAAAVGTGVLAAGGLTITAPVRLGAIVRADDGKVQFQLTGAVGQSYIVQGSVDLAQWSNLSTNIATGAVVSFTDTAAVNFSRRFYRVLLAP